MREKALKILQEETGSFEENSRLRSDVLDAMIKFLNSCTPSKDSIEKVSQADYANQTKWDNAYDRKKGFQAGVKWVLDSLKQ